MDHELVKFDDETGVGIVSITEHAQEVLGDVVFVELPAVGTTFAQGGEFGADFLGILTVVIEQTISQTRLEP